MDFKLEELAIYRIKSKNCFSFSEEIVFSAKADMRNKKFASNVHIENRFHILKTAGIYGPNSAGKTCLVKGYKGAQISGGNYFRGLQKKIIRKCVSGLSSCHLIIDRGKYQLRQVY